MINNSKHISNKQIDGYDYMDLLVIIFLIFFFQANVYSDMEEEISGAVLTSPISGNPPPVHALGGIWHTTGAPT